MSRKYKPTTRVVVVPSVSDFVRITRSEPEKSLVRPLHKTGGRNSNGRVTARHRGGGYKRAYCDRHRSSTKDGVPALVAQYDPRHCSYRLTPQTARSVTSWHLPSSIGDVLSESAA